MLSQGLIQKQTQRLVITPDLRQSIELLPLSNLELSEKIQKELEENPLLEAESENLGPEVDVRHQATETDRRDDEEESWKHAIADRRPLEHMQSGQSPDGKQQFLENAVSSSDTLADHLLWQLRLSNLSEAEMRAGEVIISAIDNRGLLTVALPELIRNMDATLRDAKRALFQIQRFDPLGCGASSIQESLYIQALVLHPEDTVTTDLLQNHFPDLERLDFRKIERNTGYTEKQIEKSLRFVKSLEPYPGTLYAPKSPDYVFPDISVKEEDGQLRVYINDEWIPNLQINEDYKKILKSGKGVQSDRDYVQAKMNSAVWLIRSIKQRRQTLEKVMRAILDVQVEFFRLGTGHMRPLTLKEIAERMEMHESTVSRITTNKYVQTKWGTFELKFFFSSGLRSNRGDDRQSAKNVQDRIRQLIEAESEENPLSDQEIAKRIAKEGVEIARRTVAKYRQLMHILPAERRGKIKRAAHNSSNSPKGPLKRHQ